MMGADKPAWRLDRLAAAFICIALAICGTRSGNAQFLVQANTVQELLYCTDYHFYNSRSVDAPSIIASSFQGQGNVLTFRTCTDMQKHTHYFVRKPRPIRGGICRIFEEEIFPGTAQDEMIVDILYDGTAHGWYFTMSGWKSEPPEDWGKLDYRPQGKILAQASDGSCPPTDDKGYIPVGTMTDGMLSQFFKLWRSVTSSPAAFDKAFANTTSTALIGLGFKEDHDALVRDLRGYLFGAKHTNLAPYFLDCSIIGSREGCAAGIQGFTIGFDVGDNGLKITQIDPEVVT